MPERPNMLVQVNNFGKGMTPINRAGQPAELAPAFVFLANNAGTHRPLPICIFHYSTAVL